MYFIGIDVGSTFSKYCVLNEAGAVVELFTEQTPIRQKAYFEDKLNTLCAQYSDCHIISCGYGRKNVPGQKKISELTALAAGVFRESPDCSAVLDIGGQDTKIIFQENGKLKAFFTNEKCAAGCGMFLKTTLEMVQMDFQQFSLTSQGMDLPELKLSNVCAVFAQSEIVEAIAEDIPAEQIIRAVLRQIFIQARILVNKVDCPSVALSGGISKIPGIIPFAEQILGKPVLLPQRAPYLSAIGCAELCYQSN